MLAKSNRLNRADFTTFFNSGKRYHSPMATIVVSPHDGFHGAVVVGKKVSKKAVIRNKLRRQVYNLLTTHLKQQGWCGVVIVVLKPAITSFTRENRRTTLIAQIEHVRERAYNSSHV